MRLSLRPYQTDGLNDIRGSMARAMRAPLYVLPTGGGKTVCYSAIGEGAAARGNRVLILEHRKELIRQASLALGRLGVRHRIIAPPDKIAEIRRAHAARAGQPCIDQNAIIAVASVQTLARRMEWLQEFDPALIVIDEAHHAVAGTWARIIAACPKARLLGVTATPCRTDGQGLGDVFDDMIHGPSIAWLIAEGYLVRPVTYAPPLPAEALEELKKLSRKGGDVKGDEVAAVLDKPTITGCAVEHYTKIAPGRPAIVFCASIKHANHVCEAFCAAGYRFRVVTGDMEDDDRDAAILGLADGTVQGIVTVDVVSEGTDVPVAEVAIMLRSTESLSLFLQQGGRILRPVYADGYDLSTRDGRLAAIAASEKPFAVLLDHVANTGQLNGCLFIPKHGFLQWEREWSLQGKKKRAKGEAQERLPRTLQCPNCYMTHEPTPACPACGHVYDARLAQPREIAGELRVVDASPEDVARQQSRLAQGKAGSVESLMALGHSRSRAEHIVAARAEKDRLQADLRDMLIRWSRATGRGIREGWGFAMADIRDMTPKRLRELIDQVGQALFAGPPSNDNRQADAFGGVSHG